MLQGGFNISSGDNCVLMWFKHSGNMGTGGKIVCMHYSPFPKPSVNPSNFNMGTLCEIFKHIVSLYCAMH